MSPSVAAARCGIFSFAIALSTAFTAEAATGVRVAGLQVVTGHLRPDILAAPVAGRLPAAQMLHLTIGLPLRNRAQSQALAAAVSDPRSPNYRHYLTPEQFRAAFSPSLGDYLAVLGFARASHFTVTHAFGNRVALDVDAPVAAVERAFHLTMQTRLRPDGSLFYAPSNEPALALATPIVHIEGLDNERPPEPQITLSASRLSDPRGPRHAFPDASSGPGGTFAGSDFRNAYARGASETGAKECLGLYEHNASFFPVDITKYETAFNLPKLKPRVVLLDGFNGVPTVSNGEEETSLDIEAALAMAPGLSNIVVFEGENRDSILAAMTSSPFDDPPNFCHQLSASWTFSVDTTSQQLLDEMALQGQSFFVSSGDTGGFTSDTGDDRDMSNMTVVGGTELALNADFVWQSETGWTHSSGGIEKHEFVPAFQAGLPSGPTGAPLLSRAIPDVAAVADHVFIFTGNGGHADVGGTSVATPLWAAETALVNQDAAMSGLAPVGFLNPALYALAANPGTYATNFHDIVTGSNGPFSAQPGYDLVTGLGSPKAPLIAALNPLPASQFSQLQITIYTGSDDLRADSDLEVDFTGIGNLAPLCLMRSNNGAPTGNCTGSAYGDEFGQQGWGGWSTQVLTFSNRLANWTWAGAGKMTLRMHSHNNGLESDDNWDIQAMSVTLSNPVTHSFVQLFNVGQFGFPHTSGHCYWRLKTAGSPPVATATFNLLPATTPSNNSCFGE
jgi:kumamolisin